LLWPFVLLLSMPSARSLVRFARARRARWRVERDECPACGYDLSASDAGALPRVWYDPSEGMRSLPRILLNALTALSLILFGATVAMWVRSYWCSDCWAGPFSGSRISLLSSPGALLIEYIQAYAPQSDEEGYWRWTSQQPVRIGLPGATRVLGFLAQRAREFARVTANATDPPALVSGAGAANVSDRACGDSGEASKSLGSCSPWSLPCLRL
jgi:hypothetical protein